MRSKVIATAAAMTLAIVLGLLDYVTGREWAISALYLLAHVPRGMGGRTLGGIRSGSALCGRVVP
jgi:hypothetical protein